MRSTFDNRTAGKGLESKVVTAVYIETDHVNALLMQRLLSERTDYALHPAASGNDGLRACEQVKLDLVLTEM